MILPLFFNEKRHFLFTLQMTEFLYPPQSNTWTLPDPATARVMFRCLASIFQNEEILMITDGQDVVYPNAPFRNFLAAKAERVITKANEIEDLFTNPDGDFWFGGLSYDLKNQWHKGLKSENINWTKTDFYDAVWFCPELVFELVGRHIILHKGIWPEWAFTVPEHDVLMQSAIMCVVNEEIYGNDIDQIQEWIKEGLTYEVNYCVEFLAAAKITAALGTFFKFLEITKAPFSSYLKFGSNHILCASPERFLQKSSRTIISQPIKGTMSRAIDVEEDAARLKELTESEKDRAENVMIVDLVRNDLARVSEWGSTQVIELCQPYSFPFVHQLISTVQSTLREGFSLFEVMASAFPMGSMTGAPKLSSMKLIEEIEHFRRGMYSGTLGYLLPDGDADFNVIIRTLFYQDQEERIRFCAGGAITLASTADSEWQELLLKTQGIRKLLQSQAARPLS
jgi:para-aminobenzoate synthetase component 1